MKSISSPTETRDFIAVLGAMAIFLSLIEYIIPKPIPFIKLGLANLPVMIAISKLRLKDYLLLILLKSIGSGLISGTIFSWIFLYSLSGSLSSGLVMLLLKRLLKNRVSMIGISVTGALASNIVQISIAIVILGRGAKYIGIPILISGFISGLLLGIFANKFISESKWLRSISSIQY